MASFIESALLKMSSENSTPKASPESCTFEERLGSLVKQLEPKPAETQPTTTSTPPATPSSIASLLLELTEVASQLARVEKMLDQCNESAPEEENAKRYHEISLQALQCSRNMLMEKQTKCLKDLGALIGTPSKATEGEAQPIAESIPASTTWSGWGKADIEAVPEFVPPVDIASKLIGSGSLRQDLELLRQRQPEHVIIVRKIKKLGFESPQMLDEHFSQYGEVKELLVAHSHVKPTAKRPNGRVRPAALGFVVMANAESAQNAFKAGVDQMICGHLIELASFESFDSHYADEEEQ
jgi:hypothetical protein